jgi:predicted SnoaL-like aldol condensation-catalyzing enzyme
LESLPKAAAKVNTVRAFQDGNFVFTHTEYNIGSPKVGFDIFRLEEGKIVEHWDNLQQTAAEPSPSGHTMTDGPTAASNLDKTEFNKTLLQTGSEGVEKVKQTTEAKNKAIVLEAFDTLFNERDYTAAERYWSPNYIQHSAHIAPGREGLFNLIKSLPPTLKYEPGSIVAEGDFVIVHGRFSGFGAPVNWIAADIVRIQNGILIEHWDVIQDEATEEQSKSGAPMFGKTFQTYR